jgi:hypothetical protein
MGDKIERRDFLRGVGFLASAAATTALIERPALAQNASQTRAKSMTFQANKIIDFHSHHIPARFEVTAARTAPATQRARWEALARTLSDEDLLLKDIRNGELGARVVSIPAQLIADADGRVPHDTFMAMNDDLAALVARYPGRIYGQELSTGPAASGLIFSPNELRTCERAARSRPLAVLPLGGFRTQETPMNNRTTCLLLGLCTAGAWWPAHAQNLDISIVKLPQHITYKGLPGAPQHLTLFGDASQPG